MAARSTAHVAGLDVAAYTIPTDAPESDGTLAWDATTLVVVHARAGDAVGLGFSYTAIGAAAVVRDQLRDAVVGLPALDVPRAWQAMRRAVRNIGRSGVAASAIAAVDIALWDLKARLLAVPLIDLFGAVRDAVPVYGSGGFTSYDDARLCAQLGGWAEAGFGAVKMKIGRDAAADPVRVRAARAAVGEAVTLMVDANGAYDRSTALAFAETFAACHVAWFEEPVTSDDVGGLRFVRDRAPAGMQVAAGEYGYALDDFALLLDAEAVDVLQADASRCCGYTGFLHVAALCTARHVPLSTHTAPALHLPVACAALPVRHMEYFHDHVRIESMLFDGVAAPVAGVLAPDRTRPGHGLVLRPVAAERYRVGCAS